MFDSFSIDPCRHFASRFICFRAKLTILEPIQVDRETRFTNEFLCFYDSSPGKCQKFYRISKLIFFWQTIQGGWKYSDRKYSDNVGNIRTTFCPWNFHWKYSDRFFCREVSLSTIFPGIFTFDCFHSCRQHFDCLYFFYLSDF